ncbi:MAG: peptide chain release factor 3, partial [Bdellovibrionales bacterium]|nr:peptide chain release factor 3 [Bdellovibrionales bacterium]
IKDPLKKKQLQKGVQQLSEEGTVQVFYDPIVGMQEPIIGVVGELQFDVMLHRLKEEYKLEVRLDRLSYTVARWPMLEGKPFAGTVEGSQQRFKDKNDLDVVLLDREWDIGWLEKENPKLEFSSNAGFSR